MSDADYGRDRLIRARCWLGWLTHLPALSCDSRTIPRRNFAVRSDSGSGLETGDFSPDSLIPAGCMVRVGNPYMLISDIQYRKNDIECFVDLDTSANADSDH